MSKVRSALVLGAFVCSLAVLAVPAPAGAQLAPSLNVQQFVPVASWHEFLAVDSARTLPKLAPSFDLTFNYAHRVLQRSDAQFDRTYGVIDGLVGGDFRFGFGITRFLEIGVNVPFMQLAMTGTGMRDFGQGVFYAVGDVGLQARIAILNQDKMPLGLAVIPFVTFPTGRPLLYLSDGVPTFGAKLALSKRYKVFHWAASAGYMVKPGHAIVGGSISAGGEIPFGVAVGVSPAPEWLDVNVELMGAGMVGAGRTEIPDGLPKGLLHIPLELLANLRFRTPIGLDVVVGGGPGLTPGAGTPAFRVLAGVSWSPPSGGAADRDGDGILGRADRCPTEAEDVDGFEDEDGCPDDNDGDGIADAADQCPADPEDKDGWIDNDGCPDTDNDQDGVLDAADKCPNEAEDIDLVKDEDGCPEDNDEDGVPDAQDQCPDSKEDKDAFKDTDGCADPDNDGDGILDTTDSCPDQPENVNGNKDDDGCPDDVKAVVKGEKILILDRVFFVTAEDTIIAESYPVLDAVAQTLVDNPRIKKVRVEGHTDNRGGEELNQTLSEKRAAAVVKYLVGKGVDATRLESAGYGMTRPLDTNDTDAGQQKNRRVEFAIVEQDVPVEAAPAPVEAAPVEAAPVEAAPAEAAPAKGKGKGKKGK